MDLAEFLLARITEDEQAVQALVNQEPDGEFLIRDRPIHTWIREHPTQEAWEVARRVLAECEAKRHMIDAYERADRSSREYPSIGFVAFRAAWRTAVANLARPFTEHSDYQPAWEVEANLSEPVQW